MKNVTLTMNDTYNEWVEFVGETVLIQRVHYEMQPVGMKGEATLMRYVPMNDEEVKEVRIEDVVLPPNDTEGIYLKYKDMCTEKTAWMWVQANWKIVGVLDSLKHGVDEKEYKKVKK